jgi:hypothetical protein
MSEQIPPAILCIDSFDTTAAAANNGQQVEREDWRAPEDEVLESRTHAQQRDQLSPAEVDVVETERVQVRQRDEGHSSEAGRHPSKRCSLSSGHFEMPELLAVEGSLQDGHGGGQVGQLVHLEPQQLPRQGAVISDCQ